MMSECVSSRRLKGGLLAICLCVIPASAIFAGDSSNPYIAIAARNVFGLRPPPPPPAAPEVPPRPKPTLVLTGVADFVQEKWAFVTRTDPGARQPKSYTLGIGEQEGGLHLVAINAAAATATLVVDGAETVTLKLTAATNRPPPAAAYSQVGRGRVPPPFRRR